MADQKNLHKSVMTKEVVANIGLKSQSIFIDATFGGGGHTVALMEEIKAREYKKVKLIAYDLDSQVKNFLPKDKVEFINDNFANISSSNKVKGVLADLGLSQNQITSSRKGFTYKNNEPLDMRYNEKLGVTAADLLNGLGRNELKKMFSEYADLKYSRLLAEKIADHRSADGKFTTTADLNKVIDQVLQIVRIDRKNWDGHKAKIYQALRIAVNLEYQNLKEFLSKAYDLLQPEGKLLIISFHSGEEKIIDQFLKQKQLRTRYKVIKPTVSEIQVNPRARSAKLHVITK